MNLPTIHSFEQQAIDIVVYVLNTAVNKIGVRQDLAEIAECQFKVASQSKVSLAKLRPPLAINCQKLIAKTIERQWRLLDVFKYHLTYKGSSQDEYSNYYYYEAIFSQPTVAYPIPQATASVFFRVQEKQIEPVCTQRVPMIVFRIEGHHKDYDIRYITLSADWILAVIQMKIKFFRRVEELQLF